MKTYQELVATEKSLDVRIGDIYLQGKHYYIGFRSPPKGRLASHDGKILVYLLDHLGERVEGHKVVEVTGSKSKYPMKHLAGLQNQLLNSNKYVFEYNRSNDLSKAYIKLRKRGPLE